MGTNMWEAVKVAYITRIAGVNYLNFVLPALSSDDPPSLTDFKSRVRVLIENIGTLAVADRFDGGGNLRAVHALGELIFLNLQQAGAGGDVQIPNIPTITRLQIDDLNAYGVGNPTQVDLTNNWAGKRIQVERVHRVATKYGFFSQGNNQTHSELPDPVDAAAIKLRLKTLRERGQFNIHDQAIGANNNMANGQLAAANHYWLCLPYRRDGEVLNHEISHFDVTSCEPHFSYSSATTILGCEHPLDTARLGRMYPSLIQDYSLKTRRDYTLMRPSSLYQHDNDCKLVILPGESKIVSFRERDDFIQSDKSVSRVGEVSHTIVRNSVRYTKGETPFIELETRQGQFEYIFLYCRILTDLSEPVTPTTEPIISSMRYFVRGKENNLVYNMDRYDLEHCSRRNCHELSDWRQLHSEGRGILLHLADLGLTESVPYGKRDRLVLKFQLLTTIDPPIETQGQLTTEYVLEDSPREFKVALIRFNRLLTGSSSEGCRFSFLNDRQ